MVPDEWSRYSVVWLIPQERVQYGVLVRWATAYDAVACDPAPVCAQGDETPWLRPNATALQWAYDSSAEACVSAESMCTAAAMASQVPPSFAPPNAFETWRECELACRPSTEPSHIFLLGRTARAPPLSEVVAAVTPSGAPDGGVWIAGATREANYLDFLTTFAPDWAHEADEPPPIGGVQDGFMVRLESQSSMYADGRFLGGSEVDGVTALAWVNYTDDKPGPSNEDGAEASTRPHGSVWVAGYTNSFDLLAHAVNEPNATPPHQPYPGGCDSGRLPDDVRSDRCDGFLGRLDKAGNVKALTYVGGSGGDVPQALSTAQDGSGSVWMVSTVASVDVNVTAGACQRAFNGGRTDALLSKYSVSGDLLLATYIGTASDDTATAVVSLPDGGAYVGGWSMAHKFPAVCSGGQVVSYASAPDVGGGASYGFVLRVDAAGNFVRAVLLGAGGGDVPPTGATLVNALDLAGFEGDGSDDLVWVGGTTSSDVMRGTDSALHPQYLGGDSDGFLMALNPDLSIAYLSFIGGSAADEVTAIARGAADGRQRVTVTGRTLSADMHTTPLSPLAEIEYNTYSGLGWDGLVAVFEYKVNGTLPEFSPPPPFPPLPPRAESPPPPPPRFATPCPYCEVDLLQARHECSFRGISPIKVGDHTRTGDHEPWLFSGRARAGVDMRAHETLFVAMEVCGPYGGYIFNLGDSPSNDGKGGDAGHDVYDSELQLRGRDLEVYGASMGGEAAPLLKRVDNFLPKLGEYECVGFVVRASSGSVSAWVAANASASFEPDASTAGAVVTVQDANLFRVKDGHDTVVYAGLNRVVSLADRRNRWGKGLASAVVVLADNRDILSGECAAAGVPLPDIPTAPPQGLPPLPPSDRPMPPAPPEPHFPPFGGFPPSPPAPSQGGNFPPPAADLPAAPLSPPLSPSPASPSTPVRPPPLLPRAPPPPSSVADLIDALESSTPAQGASLIESVGNQVAMVALDSLPDDKAEAILDALDKIDPEKAEALRAGLRPAKRGHGDDWLLGILLTVGIFCGLALACVVTVRWWAAYDKRRREREFENGTTNPLSDQHAELFGLDEHELDAVARDATFATPSPQRRSRAGLSAVVGAATGGSAAARASNPFLELEMTEAGLGAGAYQAASAADAGTPWTEAEALPATHRNEDLSRALEVCEGSLEDLQLAAYTSDATAVATAVDSAERAVSILESEAARVAARTGEPELDVKRIIADARKALKAVR